MHTAEVEEEEWIERIKRNTRDAEDKMRAANIPCWIEAQRKMKWRLAVRIASHPEERWTKEAATWNFGPRIEAKASRRAGRPKKIRKDDINKFVKLDETEETRGNDLKNNDTWLKAAKDQKQWKEMETDYIRTF